MTRGHFDVGQPYTLGQVCGSGFQVIKSHSLAGATVYLLWNTQAKANCVVKLKTSQVGIPTATGAWLQPVGASRNTGSGNFKYYAGPVKISAPGCVVWGGSAGTSNYTSPSEHCTS